MNEPIEPSVVAALRSLGIDLDALGPDKGEGTRVVVVQASMEDALKALSRGSRDQVVMTRIDSDTARALDRWVSAGVAKSRSEAAALFLQEGLKLREPDLADLSGVIDDYEKARERMRKKAKNLMGEKFKPPE
jgi:hypothetical protein